MEEELFIVAVENIEKVIFGSFLVEIFDEAEGVLVAVHERERVQLRRHRQQLLVLPLRQVSYTTSFAHIPHVLKRTVNPVHYSGAGYKDK